MQIVSLTTDYGTKDYYTAELKASLLSVRSDFNIIDVSHNIDHFDITQAAFFLKNTLKFFTQPAIHIVSVNCNINHRTPVIAFQKNEHFFIGPDNGVFSLIFDDLELENVYKVELEGKQIKSIQQLLAATAGYLSHGLPLQEIGPKLSEANTKIFFRPVVTSTQVRATVLHIDHFGNLIINLEKQIFEKVRNGRSFEIFYNPNDPIIMLSRKYSDVPVGDVVAFFNEVDYLEIAVNMGNAAELLGLEKNETIQINFFD